MTGPLIVGVDCGTQSAKVVVYDAAGRAVGQGQRALRAMERPRHGVAVHPDDDIWDAICDASRAAMADLVAGGGSEGSIVGIGICPIRCCKAFLRADGTLVEPVISWMDDRAYQAYVCPEPDALWATTLSGYVAHRFTGEFRDTAANNILIQFPIDIDTWQWSDDMSIYPELGVTRDQLFVLQMPGDVIGPLSASAASATGLPVGVPVVHTANDKAVEMLGTGTLGDSTALISLGTYIAAMVHGSQHHSAPSSFWTNFASVPGRYLYESGGVRRGMWTLTWFLDLLGPEMAAAAAADGVTREAYVEREAVLAPAGSDGLLTVLDWLAPTDKPYRKGSMLGFDARHGRGHVYRSIMEAIAMTMKHHVDAMTEELGIGLDDIVLSGGGSQSSLFMQVFADVFGLPASRPVGAGGASLGAAMCAAAACGLHPDIETASARMAPRRESFQPDLANTDLYRRVNDDVYQHVRERTDQLFAAAYPLFH